MGEDHEHIWARVLPEAHHRAFFALYHLSRFLDAADGRRERYFTAVEKSRGTLRWVLERDPLEQDVLSLMALILGKDRTFLPYVSKHGGASQALDPNSWRFVLEAGAGAIMGEYLIACEDRTREQP